MDLKTRLLRSQDRPRRNLNLQFQHRRRSKLLSERRRLQRIARQRRRTKPLIRRSRLAILTPYAQPLKVPTPRKPRERRPVNPRRLRMSPQRRPPHRQPKLLPRRRKLPLIKPNSWPVRTRRRPCKRLNQCRKQWKISQSRRRPIHGEGVVSSASDYLKKRQTE